MVEASDTYQTISGPSEGEYKEKGSKFMAYAFSVSDISEVESKLLEVKSLHSKARHHCYAYRLGILGEPHRANDDGEPSGTAGRPILGQLMSVKVSDTLVIVVRYFGGTKLGASGLIHAYKTAARVALDKVQTKQIIVGTDYKLEFSYGEMGHVMNVIKSLNLNIKEKEFESLPTVIVSIRNSQLENTLTNLKAKLLNISTEQVEEDTSVPFCKIEPIC